MDKISWLKLAKRNIEEVNIKQAIRCINEVIELIEIDEQPAEPAGITEVDIESLLRDKAKGYMMPDAYQKALEMGLFKGQSEALWRAIQESKC